MSYKFIYFDLDDTLLDHRAAERAGLKDVYNHFAIFDRVDTVDLIDTYQRVNGGLWKQYSAGDITREQLQQNRFEQTLQQLDLDTSRYSEVGQYYMNCYCNHWQWVDGAKDAFDRICNTYPVGILTNGFAATQQKKFESFNLYNTADFTVISEEVSVLKPDPKVFKHATKLTGFEPDKILYVGDSFHSDVEGGSSFGWNTAWFTQNTEPRKHHKADYVFNNFEDLVRMLNVNL